LLSIEILNDVKYGYVGDNQNGATLRYFCASCEIECMTKKHKDRGFECLVLSDCCAATELKHHEAALSMIHMQGGIFSAVASSETLLAGLAQPSAALSV